MRHDGRFYQQPESAVSGGFFATKSERAEKKPLGWIPGEQQYGRKGENWKRAAPIRNFPISGKRGVSKPF